MVRLICLVKVGADYPKKYNKLPCLGHKFTPKPSSRAPHRRVRMFAVVMTDVFMPIKAAVISGAIKQENPALIRARASVFKLHDLLTSCSE